VIFALDRDRLIKLLVIAVIAIICLVSLPGGTDSSIEVWQRRGLVTIVISMIVLALGIPTIFGFVHKIVLGKVWLFPRLDGEWDAEIHSNWPRIQRMYEAACGHTEVFDAVTGTLSPAEETAAITRAIVTIESSLLLISMKLEPLGSERVSRTRFVRPQWKKPDLPEISYVYEQVNSGSVSVRDTRKHFGSGRLSYDSATDTMTGEYWTQRRDESGFNTAGTIKLCRRRPTNK
jgi:hypothetical protein